MDDHFYAKGKLLLTSEFMILHGAKALAVPLKLGQSLQLTEKNRQGSLHWTATHGAVTWFETVISLDRMEVIDASSSSKAENLVFILEKILEIAPGFRDKLENFDVHTDLEFDPAYGFGSSSTLTSLLAQWAGIDAMQLHFHISKGSGYDVACAQANSALLYQVINEMPVIESVEFNPDCSGQLWLAYLGHKQDSAKSIAAFLEHYQPDPQDIDFFSGLTCEFLKAGEADEFGHLITRHENKLAGILNRPPVKDQFFADFRGYVKSLGAWGGDFVLLVTEWSAEELGQYLSAKGIDQWYSFNEIVC